MSAIPSNEHNEGPSPRLIKNLATLHSYFLMLCGDRQNSPWEGNGFSSLDVKAFTGEEEDVYIMEVFDEMLDICHRFFKKANRNVRECSTDFITLLGDEPQSRFSNDRKVATPVNSFVIIDNTESYWMDWDDLNRHVTTPKQFLIWYIANAIILKVFNTRARSDNIEITANGEFLSKVLLLAHSLFYHPANEIPGFFKEAGLELTAEDHAFIEKLFTWDDRRHNSPRMYPES